MHRIIENAPQIAASTRGRCGTCGSGMNGRGTALLGAVRAHPIRRCPRCGLTFVHPKPNGEELAELYTHYHADTGQLELNSNGESELFDYVAQRIAAIAPPPGELLDIGASYGHFLALARSTGYTVRGLEIAAEPARAARERLGLEIDETALENAAFAANRFSAVTLLNVLEHVDDPYATVEECLRIIRPGGALVVVVPNLLFAYPYFRATRAVGLNPPVPTSAYDVPFHLSLFSPSSLRRLLTAAGWEVESLVDAPVIRNEAAGRTAAKRAVRLASSVLSTLTAGACLLGYSQIAVARKAAAPERLS